MNIVNLSGNLSSDPELRYTQSGTAVTNFRLATNDYWNDKNGNKQERVEFHRITVWGKLAENCEKYLVKGSKVTLTGKLVTRKWEDRDGVTRYTTEIHASSVEFGGKLNKISKTENTKAGDYLDAAREEFDYTQESEMHSQTIGGASDDDLPF